MKWRIHVVMLIAFRTAGNFRRSKSGLYVLLRAALTEEAEIHLILNLRSGLELYPPVPRLDAFQASMHHAVLLQRQDMNRLRHLWEDHLHGELGAEDQVFQEDEEHNLRMAH